MNEIQKCFYAKRCYTFLSRFIATDIEILLRGRALAIKSRHKAYFFNAYFISTSLGHFGYVYSTRKINNKPLPTRFIFFLC